MSLQNTVRTHDDLTALTKTIRNTFNLNLLSALIGSFVTDDNIKATLDKIVGKKGAKTIKQSDAEAIAASMLGFKNPNAMFKHYKNVIFFAGQQYMHIHRHGEYDHIVWAREDVFLTSADLIAFDFIDCTLTRTDERIEHSGQLGTLLTLPEIKGDPVFDTDNIAATVFNVNNHVSKLVDYQGVLFNQNSTSSQRIDEFSAIMEESDSNLAMTNNDFLKSMDTMDVCYPIAMQDDLESIHSLLCWVVDSFCCGSVEDIPKGITRTSGEITLSGGYNLDYDIGEKVFGVSKDGNLVKILVFTTYEKDVRMDNYHLLTA